MPNVGRPFIDIAGQVFRMLTAVECVGIGSQGRIWRCSCACGRETTATIGQLRAGAKVCCGCVKGGGRNRTHGEAKADGGKRSGLYIIWTGIKQRCFNEKAAEFKWYGGRGITLHAPWRQDYALFRDAVTASIGPRPSPDHCIDRVDNDGGYVPGNLRWATNQEQSRNRGSNVLVTAFGETLCVSAWSARTGVKKGTIAQRVRLGWRPELAVTATPMPRSQRGRGGPPLAPTGTS